MKQEFQKCRMKKMEGVVDKTVVLKDVYVLIPKTEYVTLHS